MSAGWLGRIDVGFGGCGEYLGGKDFVVEEGGWGGDGGREVGGKVSGEGGKFVG